MNALDWNKKYGLFSCSKDNKVTEWDLQSASVRFKYNVYVENNIKQGNNVNAIKIIPHDQVSDHFLHSKSTLTFTQFTLDK